MNTTQMTHSAPSQTPSQKKGERRLNKLGEYLKREDRYYIELVDERSMRAVLK